MNLQIAALIALCSLSTLHFEAHAHNNKKAIRLKFGPLHEFGLKLNRGRLSDTEWVYDSVRPMLFDLVSTETIDEYGTEDSRRYIISVTTEMKARWTGDCEMLSESAMFGMRLSYETADSVEHIKRYSAHLNSFPNYKCNADQTAYSNTDNKYLRFAIPEFEAQHVGSIKNLKVSIYGVTRNTYLNMPFIQIVLNTQDSRLKHSFANTAGPVIYLKPE